MYNLIYFKFTMAQQLIVFFFCVYLVKSNNLPPAVTWIRMEYDDRYERALLDPGHFANADWNCKSRYCGWRWRITSENAYKELVRVMKQYNLTEVLSRTWSQKKWAYEFDKYQIWGPDQPDEFDIFNKTFRELNSYSAVWDASMNYTLNDHGEYYKSNIICMRPYQRYCEKEVGPTPSPCKNLLSFYNTSRCTTKTSLQTVQNVASDLACCNKCRNTLCRCRAIEYNPNTDECKLFDSIPLDSELSSSGCSNRTLWISK